MPPARRAEVGCIAAKSSWQRAAHAGVPIALGSADVTNAPPMCTFCSHLAAAAPLRERQVQLGMDAISFEG